MLYHESQNWEKLEIKPWIFLKEWAESILKEIRNISKNVLNKSCNNKISQCKRWPSMFQIWKENKKIWRKNLKRNQQSWTERKRGIEDSSPLNLLLWNNMKDLSNSLRASIKFMLKNTETSTILSSSLKDIISLKKKNWFVRKKNLRRFRKKWKHRKWRISKELKN